MTQIICSKCGEVVELAARTVVLPFVCNECTFAPCFQDTLPAPDKDVFEPVGEPTVEATTLLIADLEKQLADAKTVISYQDSRIASLRSGVDKLIFENAAARKLVERMLADLFKYMDRGFWARVFNKS